MRDCIVVSLFTFFVLPYRASRKRSRESPVTFELPYVYVRPTRTRTNNFARIRSPFADPTADISPVHEF